MVAVVRSSAATWPWLPSTATKATAATTRRLDFMRRDPKNSVVEFLSRERWNRRRLLSILRDLLVGVGQFEERGFCIGTTQKFDRDRPVLLFRVTRRNQQRRQARFGAERIVLFG